jgi:5-methyltetrahydrofolate--homocysteine methyltransferase
MRPLLTRVRAGEILVADGAVGTELLRHGLKPGDCPEAFNLNAPEILTGIARAYLEAGAEIVQTNTLGGSPLKLVPYGLDSRAAEINRSAVAAVREAVGERAYVSGSCGPSGGILKPYGDLEPERVQESFRVQAGALIEAGADLICVETMTDLREASLAVRAAREVSPSIPIMATMTFDRTPRGFYTIMGVTVEEAASGLAAAGADLVGSNCGNGIEAMVEVAHEFSERSDLPIVIQSNAGLPEMRNGELVYPETPEFMAGKARELVEIGVAVIGGCCGTTPDHIRALRQMVDSR